MLFDKSGNEISKWRVDSNDKQVEFEKRLSAIVKALEELGHNGWTAEHVIDPDSDYYAGLKVYYGTATLVCRYSERLEPFDIVLRMSSCRGEKNKSYFSVSHGDLEQYYSVENDTLRAGVNLARDAQDVAREIIRRLIIPARVQNVELVERQRVDNERRATIENVAQKLHKATNGIVRIQKDRSWMRDKNCGAEFSYYVQGRANVEGKIGYYGNRVDLTLLDCTVEQAEMLLSIIASSVPAPVKLINHDALLKD